MTHTDVRDIIETHAATRPNAADGEPSHIHIPRPSRGHQSTLPVAGDQASGPVQLELTVPAAA